MTEYRTVEVRFVDIYVDVPDRWRPPFNLVLPAGFRSVTKTQALRSARPHRFIAKGGQHDGYEEWWVADVPCGCDHWRRPDNSRPTVEASSNQ
jgi:hypothetical protein